MSSDKHRFYGYLFFSFGNNSSKLSVIFISVTFKIEGRSSNFYFNAFAEYFGQIKLNLIRGKNLSNLVAGGFVTVSIDTLVLRYSAFGWLKSKRY